MWEYMVDTALDNMAGSAVGLLDIVIVSKDDIAEGEATLSRCITQAS